MNEDITLTEAQRAAGTAPVALEFGFAGHWLRQIWRQADVAVYERSLSKERPPHELELVIVQR